ncbi:methyltransferase [uncultured Thiodictyon sp.]|jgi:precorrin-6B methylase 2|uniref:methyltransferase n=1 Tax=uncultured Thiodictyon sp. TaxID=1846217 RepID=UPI0025E39806|nr:methyltransferase [uncultured Thiodictyon sp.]
MSNKTVFDLERLALIAQGHSAFQLLWAGAELKLYDTLCGSPGLSPGAIGEALGLAEYPCRVLLVGLTALGVVEKRGDAYFNADLTERLLVSGQPESFTPVLGWQAHIVYPGLQDFLESLRAGTNLGLARFPGEGTTLYQRLVAHPALEQVFQDAMSALSNQANRHLLAGYDFSRFSHLVDAGGGDGTNAIAIARHYPDLKVTIFESPSVCEIAARNVAAAGLADRVFTHPGDFWTDPFPCGIDAILFCHMFTIWSMERNLQLLRICAAAVEPGGSVLLFNMMGDDDRSGPLSTALGSPYFLAIATGEGELHSWSDYEQAMHQAGFAEVKRVTGLPLNHGIIVGTRRA